MENKGTPVLSLCIPTYNRAEYLRNCLESIVSQECFDDRVEVVISDNCSTDDTQKVSMQYQDKYPNIHYFRNEKNIIDGNFPLSLQRATGLLRKLTNDTVFYQPGAINVMLEAAEKYSSERPQIYFLNSGQMQPPIKEIANLEEYISLLSYHMTWIGSLAIWEDDCKDLDIFIEKAKTKLAQVYFGISNFEKRGKAVICDHAIMTAVEPQKKDLTYGLYQVFYTTFLGILWDCVDAGKISNECYEKVRKELLFDFFSKWIVNQEVRKDKYRFSDENLRELVEKEYSNEPYYKEYQKMLQLRMIKAKVIKLIKK